MNKQTEQKKSVRSYLLGSLPESEAELFDELSFTDDEFAGELAAAEKDLVDAYVRGELSGAELESFESFYLASPLRREKVKFAQAFQIFAEKNPVQNGDQTSAVEKTKPRRDFNGFFGAWRPVWQWGFVAAALALLFFGGWLWTENNRLREQASDTQSKRDDLARREQELRNQIENERSTNAETERELARVREQRKALEDELKKKQEERQQIVEQKKPVEQTRPPAQQQPSDGVAPRAVSIATIILAPPVRGTSEIPTLSLPSKTDFVAAQLQLEANEFRAYRVKLVNESGQTLWQSGKIKPKTSASGNANLNVRFPAKNLKSQNYSLIVSGIGATSEAEEIAGYPIRFVLN